MEQKIDFMDVARELGGRIDEVPDGKGGVKYQTRWDGQTGQRLLAYFQDLADRAQEGTTINYNEHTDPWAMLGVVHTLRKLPQSSYIAVFDCDIPFEPIGVGDTPAEGQPVTFVKEEKDGKVFLALHPGAHTLPFEMRMGEINMPAVAPGQDLYLRIVDGAKTLYLFGIVLLLGETCRTMYLEEEEEPGKYWCVISNTPEAKFGDVCRLS